MGEGKAGNRWAEAGRLPLRLDASGRHQGLSAAAFSPSMQQARYRRHASSHLRHGGGPLRCKGRCTCLTRRDAQAPATESPDPRAYPMHIQGPTSGLAELGVARMDTPGVPTVVRPQLCTVREPLALGPERQLHRKKSEDGGCYVLD